MKIWIKNKNEFLDTKCQSGIIGKKKIKRIDKIFKQNNSGTS